MQHPVQKLQKDTSYTMFSSRIPQTQPRCLPDGSGPLELRNPSKLYHAPYLQVPQFGRASTVAVTSSRLQASAPVCCTEDRAFIWRIPESLLFSSWQNLHVGAGTANDSGYLTPCKCRSSAYLLYRPVVQVTRRVAVGARHNKQNTMLFLLLA